ARVADSIAALGSLRVDRGDLRGAEPLLREALQIQRKTLPDDSAVLLDIIARLANVLNEIAWQDLESGALADAARRADESVELIREGLRGREKLYGDAERMLYPTRLTLGMALVTRGAVAALANSAGAGTIAADWSEAESVLAHVISVTAERKTGMAGSIR